MLDTRLAPTACAATMIATFAVAVACPGARSTWASATPGPKYTLGRVVALRASFADGTRRRRRQQGGRVPHRRLRERRRGIDRQTGRRRRQLDCSASGVFPLGGDSLLLYDGAGRKFLHLTLAGGLAAVVPSPGHAQLGSYVPPSWMDRVRSTSRPSNSTRPPRRQERRCIGGGRVLHRTRISRPSPLAAPNRPNSAAWCRSYSATSGARAKTGWSHASSPTPTRSSGRATARKPAGPVRFPT